MASPEPNPNPAFPEAQVTAALKAFWAEQTGSSAKVGNPFGSPRQTGGTVFDIQPELDSLRAVEVLLELDPVVGFELPDSVIKLGGYNSCEELVGHLVPRLHACFDRHHKAKK